MASACGVSSVPRPAAERSGAVRACRPEDLPAVVALRARVFQASERRTPEERARYFERMFGHPSVLSGALPSLVYEEPDGEVVGFHGVVERTMRWHGRPIRVAVATQLMVAPEHRGLAGRSLVRTLFAGPQDLTLSDVANDVARRLWEGLGGRCVPDRSVSWTETIRPLRHAANGVVMRGAGAAARAGLYLTRPLLAAGDLLLADRRSPPKDLHLAPLDPVAMAEAADRALDRYAVRPAYTASDLGWLLTELREKRQFGTLEGAVIRGAGGTAVGWFLYYRNGGGECEVVQIMAPPTQHGPVLDLLRAHARARGAVAFTGRLDPATLPELARRRVSLQHEGPWVLFHTPHPDLAEAIRRGEAFVSRLDGEWWMSF